MAKKNFELSMEQLEKIVSDLESGDLSLEDSISFLVWEREDDGAH
jgi:exonuclease VII small subunit